MLIGIFADAHDHVDNIRRAVAQFNRAGCGLVIFAGDFVSPLAVPPLRRLNCPLIACWGDSDGNRTGIEGGMRIVGPVADPPVCVRAEDGTRILVAHLPEAVRGAEGDCEVIVTAHTHRPSVRTDERGRLWICPGETGGWMFRRPTIALLETESGRASIIQLPELPELPELVSGEW